MNEVSKLKQGIDGDIVVYASFQLVRTLLERDLVDELRLMIYPFILGTGGCLIGDVSSHHSLRLRDSHTVGDGLVFVAYEFIREPGL